MKKPHLFAEERGGGSSDGDEENTVIDLFRMM